MCVCNVRIHSHAQCVHALLVLLTRDGNLTRPFGRAVEHGLLDGVHVLEMRVGRDVEHGPARRTVREEMQRREERGTTFIWMGLS